MFNFSLKDEVLSGFYFPYSPFMDEGYMQSPACEMVKKSCFN